jgi:lipopolysaccharide transport system ATP-binding protein
MSSEPAVRVENLSKCYQIYGKPRDRLLQMLFRGHRKYYREFWALRDVTFEVGKGETVGIIGRNGSGKSTLLQMICGTLNPTGGTIETRGRIAALLELGSGFNPEFSGRENVYMNGAVLGLSREEMDDRYEEILAFADIGDFIDQPIKTYSSGMVVRLAFAVQAMVGPDILVVDEALAVGDVRFQAKCFDRLKQLKERGTSILLVTHSGEQIVTHCDRAVLLNDGCIVEQGEPKQVVNRYMDLLFGKEKKEVAPVKPVAVVEEVREKAPLAYDLNSVQDVFSTRPGYNPHEYRWGDGAAAILDFYFAADAIAYPASVASGQQVTLALSVRFLEELVRPILGITIKSKEGVTVYGVNSETLALDEFKDYGRQGSVMSAVARFTCRLAQGDYFLSLGIATRQGEEIVPHDRRYDAIHLQVRSDGSFFGLIDLQFKLSTQQTDVS